MKIVKDESGQLDARHDALVIRYTLFWLSHTFTTLLISVMPDAVFDIGTDTTE